MENTAMIQVLGAIAYGELKAYDGAKQAADEASDPVEEAAQKKIAAEELRHHKGFVRRLEVMGADPERAMRPYREALDAFHALSHDDPVVDAMWSYLGEGVADDLLSWLRRVVDPETAEFVDSVIADEEEHEAFATERLRALIESERNGRARAGRAARAMLRHMIGSGNAGSIGRFTAFVRVGRPHELIAALVTGWARRLRAVGLSPTGLPSIIPPRQRTAA